MAAGTGFASPHRQLMEIILKPALLLVLACAVMAASACVVDPYGYGGRGYYGRDNDRGYDGDRGREDYGRRVWRE